MPLYSALLNSECRETKSKGITLANQKGPRQSIEPIKTRSKRVQARHDWFWFYS